MSATDTRWLRAAVTAMAGATLATVLLRSPLGAGGLAAISRASGAPAATTAPFVVGGWLAAAAFGTWLWARPQGRTDTDEAPPVALAVAVALGLAAPIVLVLAGVAGGSFGRLLLAGLSLELAVAAGVGLGLAAATRTPELAGPLIAGCAGLLFTLAVRFALIELWRPGPLIDPVGRVTAGAVDALRHQHQWLPVAAGGTALVASAAGAFLAGRSAWLPVVGLAPLLVRAAGTGLGLIEAGPAVLSATPVLEWVYLGVGGLLGASAGLAVTHRHRAGRSASPSPGYL